VTLARRKLDFYPTPGWAADVLWSALMRAPSWPGLEAFTWAEPCVGAGDIITPRAPRLLWTNDVDWSREATFHRNACHVDAWEAFPDVWWIVSNPPFNVAHHVVRNALAFMRARPTGVGVAMLLRLSFLEPCEDRRGLLEADPPTRLIVLPRISFTGDGHTDNLTCAWMVWSSAVKPGIEVVRKPTKLADIEGP
jgi:hypothetical protein